MNARPEIKSNLYANGGEDPVEGGSPGGKNLYRRWHVKHASRITNRTTARHFKTSGVHGIDPDIVQIQRDPVTDLPINKPR